MSDELVYLGLDCSSSCCGISAFDNSGVLVDLSYLEFKTDKALDESKKMFVKADMLLKRLEDYNFNTVFIEEALKGSNNTNTVLTLNAWNGMVRYGIYTRFRVIPKTISVNESRKLFLPEYVTSKKVKGQVVYSLSIPKELDKKELIRTKVQVLQPEIVWELNRNGGFKDSCYDMSDAYVVGNAGLKLLGVL